MAAHHDSHSMPGCSLPGPRPRRGLAVTGCLSLVLLVMGSGTQAQRAPMPVASVDMPHGGCRLSMWKDGQASISYGAMPKWARVTPGTFDFDQTVGLLRAKSYPPAERPSDGAPAGTVALPGSEALRRIDDAGWVRSLLQKAWKARMPPASGSPAEDHDWIAKVCALADQGPLRAASPQPAQPP